MSTDARSRLTAIAVAVVASCVAVGCARENPEYGLGADGGATGSSGDGGTTRGPSGGVVSGTDDIDDTGGVVDTTTSTFTTGSPTGPDSTGADDSVDSGGVSDVSGGEACDVENCQPYEVGCADGLKCTLHDEGLDGEFDKLACSAVVDGPDSVGDACIYDECGQDSCDFGLACVPAGQTAEPGVGLCRALCHEADDPCRDPQTVCIEVFGPVGLCRDRCQLLLQDCPDEEGCFFRFDSGETSCAPPSELNFEGAPCDDYSDCAAGRQCVEAATVGGCPDDAESCCTLGCDSDVGAVCANGQVCLDLGAAGQGTAGVCVG